GNTWSSSKKAELPAVRSFQHLDECASGIGMLGDRIGEIFEGQAADIGSIQGTAEPCPDSLDAQGFPTGSEGLYLLRERPERYLILRAYCAHRRTGVNLFERPDQRRNYVIDIS